MPKTGKVLPPRSKRASPSDRRQIPGHILAEWDWVRDVFVSEPLSLTLLERRLRVLLDYDSRAEETSSLALTGTNIPVH